VHCLVSKVFRGVVVVVVAINDLSEEAGDVSLVESGKDKLGEEVLEDKGNPVKGNEWDDAVGVEESME
jgi:hypothetical protein